MGSEPHRDFPQLQRLLAVVGRLRAPGGCPWDREQTQASMAPHLLEETYEALEAIQHAQPAAIREELGDVLMNVLMIAQISSEEGGFDIEDVARAIADKLVRRHPHVFGDVRADDPEEVLRNWEAIKQKENEAADEKPRGALQGVPAALPALLKAYRIGEKAARVGFDWPDPAGPREKLAEELAELDAALQRGDPEAAAAELGDVLFSVVNVARHAGINPEMALRATTERFQRRFATLERRLGPDLRAHSLQELEAAWQKAKQQDGPPEDDHPAPS